MELAPYIERLRDDLADSAAAGGPEMAEAAQRFALALDPSMRMALIEALSDAAAEITSELHDASVEVRLKGREPQFVVNQFGAGPTPPAPPMPLTPPTPPIPPEAPDPDLGDETDGSVARVTVRIPESLKGRAEDLAAGSSQSLNSWIVQAIRSATSERAVTVDLDLGSAFFGSSGTPGSRGNNPKRVQGWSR